MARQRVRRRPMSEINVVPYIDVMLVLLVIFIITAPLLTQGVKVDLPQADAQPLDVESQEPLVVTVDTLGNYYVNYGENQGSPVAPRILASRVAALLRHRPGLAVVGAWRRERALRRRGPPDDDPAARGARPASV